MDVATAPRRDRSLLSCHCSRSHRLLNVGDRLSRFADNRSDRKALPRNIVENKELESILPIASFGRNRPDANRTTGGMVAARHNASLRSARTPSSGIRN